MGAPNYKNDICAIKLKKEINLQSVELGNVVDPHHSFFIGLDNIRDRTKSFYTHMYKAKLLILTEPRYCGEMTGIICTLLKAPQNIIYRTSKGESGTYLHLSYPLLSFFF